MTQQATAEVAAPLDPVAVGQALAPFGASRTLPAEAYRSAAVFAWEQARFLAGSWYCVGRARPAGHQPRRAVSVGGEPVVLEHGGDGVLRATGPDGAPVRLAAWHGCAFVDLAGGAPELDAFAGDLGGLLAPWEPARLVPAASASYVVQANWKLLVENYHECYHCPSIHPELCRLTPPDSGRNLAPRGAWVGGAMELRAHAATMALGGSVKAVPLRGLDERRRRQVLYVGLFPNLLVSAHPDYVLTHRLEPLGPGSTRVECEWLFAPEAVAADWFDPSAAVAFWDLTNRQDWRACESVQRGMRSPGYRPGPLAPTEDAVYRFVTLVAAGYRRGRVDPPASTPA
jgi:phenylpropionate dioxygenase-like ring-hydroxylating dioxygenase large terminal subunit